MSKKSRYNIGALIGNVHSNHPKELIQGISEAAKALQVNVEFFLGTQNSILYQGDELSNVGSFYDFQFNTIYDYALMGNLDALIISYGTMCVFFNERDKDTFFQKYSEIPHVVLEEREVREDGGNAHYFISDNYQGISDIMEHLIVEHGYKKILFLGGPEDNTDANERKRAYLDAMRKYQLSVDESMIGHGKYSEFIDDEVARILDLNPDAQAICSANDEMTIGCYRECRKRDLIVGKDIAITGYDNFSMAPSMDPPLTTAEQNGYDMGYRALVSAVDLCNGKADEFKICLPAKMIKRSSCGCVHKDTKILIDDISGGMDQEKVIEHILDEIILNREHVEIRNFIKKRLLQIFHELFEKIDKPDTSNSNNQLLVDCIREIVDGKYKRFVSPVRFVEEINQFLIEYTDQIEDINRIKRMIEVLSLIHRYVQSTTLMRKEEEYLDFQRKSWMAPLFIRDLMENGSSDINAHQCIMEKIQKMEVSNAYLYLLERPIHHPFQSYWECPKKLCLAASLLEGQIQAYSLEEAPIITRKSGFTKFFDESEQKAYSAFTLFAEEIQYGLLLCEIPIEDISAMYVFTLQIGSALRFMEITKQENDTRIQLQNTLELMQEKNRLLNFISEYDELTGLLNRRGFFEHGYQFFKKFHHKRAFMVFVDLDHLKQINDTFGHSEGDFAIKSAGRIVKAGVDEGIVARIGGDEFVALLLEKDSLDAKNFVQKIKESTKAFNMICEKPYFVEFSMGIRSFVCDENVDLLEIIKEADAFLYESKKLRRTDIRKN